MPIFMYMKLMCSAKSNSPEAAIHPVKIDKLFLISVLASGATSIITQIFLLREFLSIFYGNELVVGVVLTNWLVLTGIGALFGRHSARLQNKMRSIGFLLLLIAILPIVTAFAAVLPKNFVFPLGTMISLPQIFYSSFIILLPFCVTSGFLFSLFAQTISDEFKTNLISNIYAWESLGSIIGGMVVNFIMIYFLSMFQSLIILMSFNFAVVYFIFIKHVKPALRYPTLLLCVVVIILSYWVDFDIVSRKLLFVGQELLYFKDTPHGNLTVTGQGDQKNFYENNVLLFSTNDPAANEEAVHYAMIQHPNPKKILLVSGGISGTTDEISKYDVESIDYVEINPQLIQIGKKFTNVLNNDKIKVINEDARMFIRQSPEHYDVVLINLPGPNTAQLNRFYTVEFFRELRQKLNPGAVVSMGLLETVDYIGEEGREINSIMFNTLKTAFRNVLIIPGLKNYFLASDIDLRTNISNLIDKRRIPTVYINKYYIDDNILDQRSTEIHKTLNKNTHFNEDYNPISYYRQLRYWLSQFEYGWWFIITAVIIFTIVLVIKTDAVTAGMFTGGFSALSIELILLFSFQIVYGYVYQMLGMIIMVFMGGLVIGSLYGQRLISTPGMKTYAGIQFCIALYSILLPIFLLFIKTATLSPITLQVVFLLPAFLLAMLIGLEFFTATKIKRGTAAVVSARLYGMDLFGSAIGALLTTTIFVPLIGLIKVCLLIALVNVISGCIAVINRDKYLLTTI